MKKIDAYLSNDGSIHLTKESCIRNDDLHEFERYYEDYPLFADVSPNGVANAKQLYKWLVRHQIKIGTLLPKSKISN